MLILPDGIAFDRFVVVVAVAAAATPGGFDFRGDKIDDEVVLVADDKVDDAVDDVAMVDFDLNESQSEKPDEGFDTEDKVLPSLAETNASGTATTTSKFSCI